MAAAFGASTLLAKNCSVSEGVSEETMVVDGDFLVGGNHIIIVIVCNSNILHKHQHFEKSSK